MTDSTTSPFFIANAEQRDVIAVVLEEAINAIRTATTLEQARSVAHAVRHVPRLLLVAHPDAGAQVYDSVATPAHLETARNVRQAALMVEAEHREELARRELARRAVPVAAIAAELPHANANDTTRRYTHVRSGKPPAD